ncbi:MAG: ROK family protein, partial [Bryobacteraceae bacterium]
LLALSEQGDALATRALETQARWLARGLRMIVAGLAPEVIVIVGELTRCWDRFRPALESEVNAQALVAPPPKLVPAQDGATARLRGTVALVFQKYFGPPLSV